MVLAYNGFHDERNVLARGWLQRARGDFRRPFARFGADGQLHRSMMDRRYDLLPLADRSALVATIDRVLSRYNERRLRAPDVSRLLIADMLALCRREGIRFVIANQSGNVADLLAHFRTQGTATVELSFKGRKDMTFAPYDPRPSPAGARVIAETIATFLKQQDQERELETE